MTLTQLSYIVALAETRHFASAAKHCFVTQPTLSMQIQKLEQELGVLIFDRSKQPVVMTDLGQQLVEQARVTLKESRRFHEMVRQSQGVVQGEYRLGVIPTIAPYLLPQFVQVFTQRYPGVRLILEEMKTSEIITALDHDRLDAGLAVTPLEQISLVEIPLYYEPFVLLAARDHELAKKKTVSHHDLKRDDLWLMSEGHCFRTQVLNLCGRREEGVGLDKSLRFESGHFETLIQLVQQNFGVTLLPVLSAQNVRHGLIKPFAAPVPLREVSLVLQRSYVKEAITEALVNTIQENLPEQVRPQRFKDDQVVSPV